MNRIAEWVPLYQLSQTTGRAIATVPWGQVIFPADVSRFLEQKFGRPVEETPVVKVNLPATR